MIDFDPRQYLLDSNYFSTTKKNWLPMRAAYSCWYWNYRDQLLEADAFDPEELGSEITLDEIVNLVVLRVRCWFKDTFTTALTNTGSGNIIVPTDIKAITNGANSGYNMQVSTDFAFDEDPLTNTTDGSAAFAAGSQVRTLTIGGIEYRIPSAYLMHSDPDDYTVNTTTSGLSLDLLDRARRLSSWLSKRLILGTEYDDVVWSSFMVKVSNVRMRTPELLGASRSTVAINTVVNNTTIPDGQVAGDKTAVAWAENQGDDINYYAEEHGILLSFMTIMPIQSYPNGTQRMYLRQNRFDFAWPEFAQLGMDAVYNYELCNPVGSIFDEEGDNPDLPALSVFGYQGRYYDYKSKLDEEHGRITTDLAYMTFGRDFSYTSGEAPMLNYAFVHCWPVLDMFVVDDDSVDIIRTIDVAHNYHWERCLPVPSDILR